ncbi:MAG: hypothetical protein A2284_01935 [Deltaproteobacteria bacterium RIFOXYA12_FULL_61_11]|nr:MAG: hypothetical protein A2284_01935 [Deltaproteobacteria bacterium RIFOXYA12_FULL_61_11]
MSLPLEASLFIAETNTGFWISVDDTGTDPLNEDTDGDGELDGEDLAPLNSLSCHDLDGDTCDECASGALVEPANDGPDRDSDGVCDAGDQDYDNDGVPDDQDLAPHDRFSCHDLDNDTCNECSSGTVMPVAADGPDLDEDGLCDAGDTDQDGDGVVDQDDSHPRNALLCHDLDSDTCDECATGTVVTTATDGTDTDSDGLCNAGDTDDDGDGIDDSQEALNGTDPTDEHDPPPNPWVNIPGGTFMMGQDGVATPVHQVTLSAYRIQKYEVTAGDYSDCVMAGKCPAADTGDSCTYQAAGKADHPINCVDWSLAQNYCYWLGGNLPTEAQWEYAARGSVGRIYPWGNDAPTCTLAQYLGCDGETVAVGSKLTGVSPFGLHDMAGNVWEWVADCYGSYPSEAQVDPTGPAGISVHVLRGGSWGGGGDSGVRSASRVYLDYKYKSGLLGFRCASPGQGWTADTQAPSFTDLTIDGGTASTKDQEVLVHLSGTDDMAIIAYCLKEDSAPPLTNATCWKPIAATATLSVDYLFTLSDINGQKTVYAWLNDAASNLSAPAQASIVLEHEVGDPGTDEWVTIPGGTFQMGSTDGDGDEEPVHQVTLSAYRIQKYEVTAGDYSDCVTAGECTVANTGGSCTYQAAGKEDHPINCVDWHQARAYCQWRGGDLPTEAQWEYAARGNNGHTYPWGNEAPDSTRLNYNGTIGETTAVGTYLTGVSSYGLFDMSGNVWEWVADWYSTYPSAAQVDPTGPGSGSSRVLRGGGWSGNSFYVRSAVRGSGSPGDRNNNLGFRCASPP